MVEQAVDHIRCFVVRRSGESVTSAIELLTLDDLPLSDAEGVRVAVEFSSLNYKDAMAATGHSGIVRKLPHVPGIDAVGTVLHSPVSQFTVGQKVIVTGYDLGVGQFGAWAQQIRVLPEWIVPLPSGLSPIEAMTLGTAGFTAAQCVRALQDHKVAPDSGPIIVSGATGGVGSLSVRILAKLGYHVVALTGKPEQHDQLRQWGAREVIQRGTFVSSSPKPLLHGTYAGAIDAVGGDVLATLLRSVSYRGCIASCGLTGGSQLNTTVYPFLLRGITLQGIDSAMCPMAVREKIWQLLAGPWKPEGLEAAPTAILLEELPATVKQMLAGQLTGRKVVRVSPS